MEEELKVQKLKAEIEKLNAESSAINHPLSKPSNWLPFFIAGVGIFTAIAQWQVSSVKQESSALEAKRQVFESEKTLQENKNTIVQLKKKTHKFKKEIHELKKETRTLEIEKIQLIKKNKEKQYHLAKLDKILSQKTKLMNEQEKNENSSETEIKIKEIDKKVIEGISDLNTGSDTNINKDDNKSYRIFFTYYPSRKDDAILIKEQLIKLGYKISYFDDLKEGQLYPRQSEIIFYSKFSKRKAVEIKDSLQLNKLGSLPVSKSPSYGDSIAKYKIYINLF